MVHLHIKCSGLCPPNSLDIPFCTYPSQPLLQSSAQKRTRLLGFKYHTD